MTDVLGPAGGDAAGFRLLCVCEGNLCRSPVAELLLADALTGSDVVVASAGTRAVVGSGVAPGMRPLLARRSIDAGGFRSRQLDAGDLRAVDLVLTMIGDQRRQVVERVPAVVRRVFTLRELARLLGDLASSEVAAPTVGARLRRAVPAAASRRRYRSDPVADDIADPWGRGDAAYQRAFDEVAEAVDRVVAVVGQP